MPNAKAGHTGHAMKISSRIDTSHCPHVQWAVKGRWQGMACYAYSVWRVSFESVVDGFMDGEDLSLYPAPVPHFSKKTFSTPEQCSHVKTYSTPEHCSHVTAMASV